MDCKYELFNSLIIKDVEMDISKPIDVLDADSFSCIIDKGCLDSIVCSDSYSAGGKQMIDNVHRILAPGASFICVSYGKPETRLVYLKHSEYKWKVEIVKIGKK